MNILILTTAITRPELHITSFTSYNNYFKNYKNKIKWIINIDKINDISQDDTKNNINKILNDYDLKFILTKNPSFLQATKNLMIESKKHINNNTCIFWLEDDWIINDKMNFDLLKMIDNFVLPNSYVSLVFNMLGSFPPFFMGFKLYQSYVEQFLKINKNKNPEKISRSILREMSSNNNIKYYVFLDEKNIYDNINNDDLIYKESYLQINDYNILIDCDVNFNNVKFNCNNICTFDKYKNDQYDKIIFVRFGYAKLHEKYNISYFVDIGRKWKNDL